MDGLGRRVLVAAFDGWNDAGEAASAALAQLRENGDYESVFTVDPELYFDYQYTRPSMVTEADGSRVLRWPETVLLRPRRAVRGTQLWLLTGVEPRGPGRRSRRRSSTSRCGRTSRASLGSDR